MISGRLRAAAALIAASAMIIFAATGCSSADSALSPDSKTDFDKVKFEKYEYVWGDEFNGDALDESKWSLKEDMGGTKELELSKAPEVINVSGGTLNLTAIKTDSGYATTYSVQTQDTMNYKYGYLEMRARVPYKHGAWPSLWLKGTGTLGENDRVAKDCMAEVDVFEVFSDDRTAVPNIHKWYGNGYHVQTGDKFEYIFEKPENLANEYHIYGFMWTPDEMSMSIDGEKYATYDLNYNFEGLGDMLSFQDPLYVLMNNHVFSPSSYFIPGDGDENVVTDADVPSEYKIDWIRLYQIPDEGAIYTK